MRRVVHHKYLKTGFEANKLPSLKIPDAFELNFLEEFDKILILFEEK